MGITTYYVGASVDGFIADPDGGIDWLRQFEAVEGLTEAYERFVADVGAIAMGAKTYEFILGMGMDWPYGDRRAWVFTHRVLPAMPGGDLVLTSDPVPAVHAAMAEFAGERDIWLVGGGALVAEFAAADLLDEIRIGVAPVLRGAGAPLLPLRVDTPMRLLGVTRFGDAFVELHYALS